MIFSRKIPTRAVLFDAIAKTCRRRQRINSGKEKKCLLSEANKRDISFLSTKYVSPSEAPRIVQRRKNGQNINIEKPHTADVYTANMGGYSSRKWYRYIFWFLFNLSVCNGLIYRKLSNFPEWVKNGKFVGLTWDLGGNFPNWESSTKTRHGFNKTQYNPKNGNILTKYNPKNGIILTQYNPKNGIILAQYNPKNGIILTQYNPKNGIMLSQYNLKNGIILAQYNPKNGIILSQYNPKNGIMLSQYNPKNGIIMTQCNPKNGIMLSQYDPKNGIILAQYNPKNGIILAQYNPKNGIILTQYNP